MFGKLTANTYPAICLHYYILQIICCEAHFYICDTSNLMLTLLPEREIAGITVCNIIGMLPAAPTSILIIMSSNLSDFGMNLIQSHSNSRFSICAWNRFATVLIANIYCSRTPEFWRLARIFMTSIGLPVIAESETTLRKICPFLHQKIRQFLTHRSVIVLN